MVPRVKFPSSCTNYVWEGGFYIRKCPVLRGSRRLAMRKHKEVCMKALGRKEVKMSKEKYYITTAIAYTSGKPHIGNNYEIVLADSIARYKRAEGYDVYFQTGTDEHGQKIELKANEAGVTPKEFVDKVAGQIKDMCDLLNISYDHFIRTTDDYHEKQVQKILRNCTTRAIFTKAPMKVYTVPPANPSGQSPSLWTVSVRTAAEK